MERHFLLVDANTWLETVAQRVNAREAAFLYDDLVVTTHGKYRGTVAVSDRLEAMTERSISTAKNANPLSGLPGNVSIQKEIEKRLSRQIQFDACTCYIDLDHFKPYNDHYGFEKGDMVIRSLAGIIGNAMNAVDKDLFNFVGHIGGDGFILLTRPSISVTISEKIVQLFLSSMPEFHGIRDFEKGFYPSINRKGEKEKFDLLSLSIGIVSTEVSKIDSYAQLASIATEVKKLAKMQTGPAIIRDRRISAHEGSV
jgi:diguanylate cyclase (GGDEF)-like protein